MTLPYSHRIKFAYAKYLNKRSNRYCWGSLVWWALNGPQETGNSRWKLSDCLRPDECTDDGPVCWCGNYGELT